jgi:hypothetical protein
MDVRLRRKEGRCREAEEKGERGLIGGGRGRKTKERWGKKGGRWMRGGEKR